MPVAIFYRGDLEVTDAQTIPSIDQTLASYQQRLEEAAAPLIVEITQYLQQVWKPTIIDENFFVKTKLPESLHDEVRTYLLDLLSKAGFAAQFGRGYHANRLIIALPPLPDMFS